MGFIAILLMLPNMICSAILWLQRIVLVVNKIWAAISWLFSAQNDIKYIRDELAGMRAFLEKAEADPETTRNKRELISHIKELAYDAEDSLDEFKRLLVQPTDQEMFEQLLIFLRDRAAPWFLEIRNWLLGTAAGCLFCGVVTCYLLGVACFILISTCFLVLRINPYFPMTQLQRLSTCFPESARTCILRVGSVLRTSFEHGTCWLRTGVESITPFLRKVHAQYWIKIEAQKLKASVELKEMRNNVIPMASNTGRSSEENSSELNAHFIQDSELVGNEGSRDKLLNILLDKMKEQTCVLTVVGCGGLGKTTLVRKVFDSQRLIDGWSSEQMTADEYEEASTVSSCSPQQAHAGPEQATCRAWITVSSSFELRGFLEKMFLELSLDGFKPEYDAKQLISKIRCHLQERRYVIVFDDVWEVGHWNFIKQVFPDNMKRSRVIVTTRYTKIAHAACVHNIQEHVYNLPSLSPRQSMELFCKIVFRSDSCPPYLEILSEKILKKCGGVPLAIKSIGGVLARKPAKTVEDWKGMLDDLGSDLQTEPEIKEMMQIMALSYNALPDHRLKRCFLYLSVFPEDCEIDSRRLEALWIAEGMIGHHERMTPEEVAESYLNELVSRSMIDAAEIGDRGRVKMCRVHDVMLEFIVKESVEQNLVTLSGKHGSPLPQAKIRRLSLQSSDSLGSLLENTRPDHLRSLFMFGPLYLHDLRSFICRCRFLRVLELTVADSATGPDLDAIGKLYHLKHLRLHCYCGISIPKSFGGLVNLETLVIQSDIRASVPAEVFQLPRLRHLKGSLFRAQPGFRCSDTLQTLDSLTSIEKGDIQRLRNLTHLTKLGVRSRSPEEWRIVCAAISEMSCSLRSLKLMFEGMKTTDGCLDSLASPPMLLQSLYLQGYLGKLPRWVNSNSLQAVTKIVLTLSGLAFDDIRALQELPNLVVLKLMNQSYREDKLHFSGQGFPHLKVLRLQRIISLKSLSFAAGSMPSLQVLKVRNCWRLRAVSNLLNLSCLKQVVVTPHVVQVSETVKAHPNNPTLTWEEVMSVKEKTIFVD